VSQSAGLLRVFHRQRAGRVSEKVGVGRGQWGLNAGSEEFVSRTDGLVAHECHGGFLMAEHLRYLVNRSAGAQVVGRRGVAQIVEVDLGGSAASERRACRERIMEGAISVEVCSWWGFSLMQDSWDLMHAIASSSNTTTFRVRCIAPRRRNASPQATRTLIYTGSCIRMSENLPPGQLGE